MEAESESEALEVLAAEFEMNNELVSNIFFEEMEVRELDGNDMAPSIVEINNPKFCDSEGDAINEPEDD